MATVQEWGRKESIIWPPRGYVFTSDISRNASSILAITNQFPLPWSAYVRLRGSECTGTCVTPWT